MELLTKEEIKSDDSIVPNTSINILHKSIILNKKELVRLALLFNGNRFQNN
jgi:hypothetical protein